MGKSVLIVKNITHEGPGLLETVLLDRCIAWNSLDLASGELFADPCQFGAVVVLGGPQSANDETPSMRLQLREIKQILHKEIPYLGICLGMQTLVKAAGGNVVKCQPKEIGFNNSEGLPYRIELTASGKEDPLFEGLEESFRVFQLHGETVEPASSGMVMLATGDGCRNQAVRVGKNAYGLQCHFELTETMLTDWTGIDSDLKRMDRIALLKHFEAFRTEYTVTGMRLLNNFLTIAGFV